jgi:hypothetical protein
MSHSYNHGLVTSSKGLAIEFIKITGLNVAVSGLCTVDDGDSGLVLKCVHTATGVYTLTFTKPYPPKVLAVIPSISSTSPTTDLIHARWTDGNYSSSAGTLELELINDDDAGTPVATDGLAANWLNVVLVFNRYKNL